jgi:hypothetical protein
MLLACAPSGTAATSTTSTAKRLATAISNTDRHHSVAGYDLAVRTAGKPAMTVRRSGVNVGVYRGDTLVSFATPTTLSRRAAAERNPTLVAQITADQLEWVRYRQFSPYALPTALELTGLVNARVSSLTAKKGTGQQRNTVTFTFKEKRTARTFVVVAAKDKRTGQERITSITVTGKSNALVKELLRRTDTGDLLAALSSTSAAPAVTFTLAAPAAAVAPPPADRVLDASSAKFDTGKYDKNFLDDLARDVLFAANRAAEARNASITGLDLNRALGAFLPHEYPGLSLRSVNTKLELTLASTTVSEVFCAQLVRYDYTKESLVLLGGAC